jgi:pimeloyl-ACP methyl ester carboxylesterase
MRTLEEQGYSSVSFDNRGSGTTVYSDPFTLSDMVADVAALFDYFAIDSGHMFGISMGGVIAQHFAAQNLGRVSSLGLVSTTCRDKFLLLDDAPWPSDLAAIVEKMRPYFSESFFTRNKLLIDAMCKQILKHIGSGGFAKGAAAQRAAIRTYDTSAQLVSLSCPVGIFHGELDQIILPAVVEEFKRLMPQATVHLYSGVGHLLLAECPKLLYEDYLMFLRDISN